MLKAFRRSRLPWPLLRSIFTSRVLSVRHREGGSWTCLPLMEVAEPRQYLAVFVALFQPSADTYIDSRQPITNFGQAETLQFGPFREALISFDVNGLPAGAKVVKVDMVATAVNRSVTSGGTIQKVAAGPWGENAITHDDPVRGAVSEPLDTLGPVLIGKSYAFSGLSKAVPGNGTVTFKISSPEEDGAAYASGESEQPPVLIVTYKIGATPDPKPVAKPETYNVVADRKLEVSPANGVLANDTRPSGQATTATLKTTTKNGTLVLRGDGSFAYTPKGGFVGSDSFTYAATAGGVSSSAATVTINVTRPPPTGTRPVASVDFETAAWRDVIQPRRGALVDTVGPEHGAVAHGGRRALRMQFGRKQYDPLLRRWTMDHNDARYAGLEIYTKRYGIGKSIALEYWLRFDRDARMEAPGFKLGWYWGTRLPPAYGNEFNWVLRLHNDFNTFSLDNNSPDGKVGEAVPSRTGPTQEARGLKRKLSASPGADKLLRGRSAKDFLTSGRYVRVRVVMTLNDPGKANGSFSFSIGDGVHEAQVLRASNVRFRDRAADVFSRILPIGMYGGGVAPTWPLGLQIDSLALYAGKPSSEWA